MRDDEAPDWLPELLPFTGDWSTYVDTVYAEFRGDFFNHQVFFRGRRVSVRKEPRDQGKEAGFWHAISEGPKEMERTPDLRRCERVRWVRVLVESVDEASLPTWESKRGSDRRILIALPDFTYVVVLADRKRYVLFLTAFYIEQQHRRDKLKQEWEAWTQAQKG